MYISELIERFKISREHQIKAIFSTLFIAENKLQTIFDKEDPNITLKQFMLLTMIKQSKEPLTLTQLGKLLGCSRQNIKKLAVHLEQKGFVKIEQNTNNSRAASIKPTQKLFQYFDKVKTSHQQKLNYLFKDYTDEEIQQLFDLLMRLYPSIEELEHFN